MGSRIAKVQDAFEKVVSEGTDFQRDGSEFDVLFEDRDTYKIDKITGFTFATRPSLAIPFSCPMVGRRGPIPWEAVQASSTILFGASFRSRKRCACYSAMITG